MTANQINFAKLQEDIRHNRISENENQRHNIETENISSVANDINRYNVETTSQHYVRQDAINEEHYARMDSETARNHLAQENETNRSNLAKEFETNRSNIAELSETRRHNVATEEEAMRSNRTKEAETKRSNKANEAIARENAISNRISAQASESTSQANVVNAKTRQAELDVSNRQLELAKWQAEKAAAYNQGSLLVRQAELDELIRHNKELEVINWQNAQMPFLINQSGDTKAYLSRSQAQQALVNAGYLQKQSDWYTWNQIVHSGVSIAEAVTDFVNAVNPLKRSSSKK